LFDGEADRHVAVVAQHDGLLCDVKPAWVTSHSNEVDSSDTVTSTSEPDKLMRAHKLG
jgi:hypothetical protein